jgi:hypothetical protein
VSDNGRGGAAEKGGLRNLRERAEARGGECTVNEVEPSGTRVSWLPTRNRGTLGSVSASRPVPQAAALTLEFAITLPIALLCFSLATGSWHRQRRFGLAVTRFVTVRVVLRGSFTFARRSSLSFC